MSKVRRWNWPLDLIEDMAPAKLKTWECEALVESINRALPKNDDRPHGERRLDGFSTGVSEGVKAAVKPLLAALDALDRGDDR